jgi:phosphoribosylglycinamide formyltransferase 1
MPNRPGPTKFVQSFPTAQPRLDWPWRGRQGSILQFLTTLNMKAGFMRVLTEGFVNRYLGRLVNIHPSLLPAFPGLKTHQQALDAGVRVHGVTVHLVTPELDHGPILDQALLQVLPGDTPETLAARVLELEHQIYPRALAALAGGQIKMVNGKLEGTLATALVHAIQ